MSPVVLRVGKFKVAIFTDDHEPIHVHVFSAEKRAKIWVNPVEVEWNKGFTSRELKRVMQIIEDNQTILMLAWRHIHPKD